MQLLSDKHLEVMVDDGGIHWEHYCYFFMISEIYVDCILLLGVERGSGHFSLSLISDYETLYRY